MSKYNPLMHHLQEAKTETVPMTFKQIEDILGFELPPSARRHRPWWSNNASNSVITNAWLSAGFKTTGVDIAREKLVFRRSDHTDTISDTARTAGHESGAGKLVISIIGLQKGSVTINTGTNLTDPLDEAWNATR